MSGRTDEEWEQLIITALSSKISGNHWQWGCLSKNNDLTRLLTLSTIQVPAYIVQGLIKRKSIELDEKSGYYQRVVRVGRKISMGV